MSANDPAQPADLSTAESAAIRARVAEVLERVAGAEAAAGRPAGSVTVVAASKTRSAAEIRAAFDAGVHHFGENYLQEAIVKQDALEDLPDLVWHFIGACQSRKAATVAHRFTWLHSLDRPSLLAKLANAVDAQPDSSPVNVCIQVNASDEPQKAGVAIADLPDLLAKARQTDGIRVRGLMAIPAPEDNAALTRMAELFERYASPDRQEWDTLSMGMSGDLEAAVKAGATHVRIGTALFGSRVEARER